MIPRLFLLPADFYFTTLIMPPALSLIRPLKDRLKDVFKIVS